MVSPEELNDVQSEEAEAYVQGVMQQRNAEIAANMAQIRAQYGLQTEGQQAQAQTEQALPQAETQTGQETAPEQPQAQQEPQEQAQQPTEEQAVPEYEMGDEVTFNGETATVVGFDEQNGMVQLQTSNGIIGVPPQALAQEQAQTESEQTQQSEAQPQVQAQPQQQEIPAEEQAAQPQEAEQAAAVPTDKEGNTDYDAIDDSAMMHDELQKEFGDEAESVLDEMIEEAEGQLAEAEKKKSVIERRRAQAKANARLNTLRGAKEVFAPQQTEQAQTEAPQAETEQEVEEKKNKKESGLPNEAKNASTLGSSAVSPEQDSESKGTESQAEKQANDKKSSIQGLENYTEDEIKELVMADIEQTLSDAGVEGVTIKGIALNGSRMRGDAREDSDLDVVVEYEGDMSEDGLFNILNENPVQIEGVKVDINPIKKGKSGSLDEYMERSRQYDAEKTAPKSAKVKSALDKVDELERLKQQKSEEQYKAREEARNIEDGAERAQYIRDKDADAAVKYNERIDALRKEINEAIDDMNVDEADEFREAIRVRDDSTDNDMFVTEAGSRINELTLDKRFDKAMEEQGEVKGKNKAKYNAEDFTGKNDKRPVLNGVHHDESGYGVATDSHVLVWDTKLYDKKQKGKTVASHNVKGSGEFKGYKKGETIDGKFPNWKSVVPKSEGRGSVEMDADGMLEFIAGAEARMQEEYKSAKESASEYDRKRFPSYKDWADEHGIVKIKFGDGLYVDEKIDVLKKMALAAKEMGMKELTFDPENMNGPLMMQGARGGVLAMPVSSVALTDINGERAVWVYDMSGKRTDGSSKPKNTTPKSKATKGDMLSALGEPTSAREFVMRELFKGRFRFVWDNGESATKGLKQHLGAKGETERRKLFWLLGSKAKGGMTPEAAAERLAEEYNASHIGAEMDDMEMLDELLDVISTYPTKGALFEGIMQMHEDAQRESGNLGYTDEEICVSLMSELESLSDNEWELLDNTGLTPIQQEALDSLILH
jgi:predicted nucleotidyltransferase